MEQMNDGILALLQDSKQMIFVCGLLLSGIAVFVSPYFCLQEFP
mgnify:CR=1 FL=1